MVAIPVALEVHVADPVRFWLLPSVYVPIALNCSVVPSAIELFAGVTAIDTSAAAATLNPVEPVMPPEAALIVVFPIPTVLAIPPLLIVATVTADDVHVAVLVRSWVVPSVSVPVAVNC